MKKGYTLNIEQETVSNTSYRRVLYTTEHLQLVLMCLLPDEEIGQEVHSLCQFIRIEEGSCKAILNDSEEYDLYAGSAIIIPSGVKHNLINVGAVALKLYSIYAPPNHKDGTVHITKASATEEHFDGVTSE